jgi:hypothetical protein
MTGRIHRSFPGRILVEDPFQEWSVQRSAVKHPKKHRLISWAHSMLWPSRSGAGQPGPPLLPLLAQGSLDGEAVRAAVTVYDIGLADLWLRAGRRRLGGFPDDGSRVVRWEELKKSP